MNFNFGLLPHKQDYKKKDKKRLLAEQEEIALREWIAATPEIHSEEAV